MGADIPANPVCLVPGLPRGEFHGGELFWRHAFVRGQDRGGVWFYEYSVLASDSHDQAQISRSRPPSRARSFSARSMGTHSAYRFLTKGNSSPWPAFRLRSISTASNVERRKTPTSGIAYVEVADTSFKSESDHGDLVIPWIPRGAAFSQSPKMACASARWIMNLFYDQNSDLDLVELVLASPRPRWPASGSISSRAPLNRPRWPAIPLWPCAATIPARARLTPRDWCCTTRR